MVSMTPHRDAGGPAEPDTHPIRIDGHEHRDSTRRPSRGWVVAGVAAAVALVTALGLAACGGSSEDGGSGAAAASSEFWVDPASSAARQIEQWRSEGRIEDANALEKLARQPVAIWLDGEPGAVESQVAGVVSQARAAGRTPVLTAYNIPNRDCGLYSSGGAEDEDAYREWLDAAARGMGGTRSVIILEPDALPQTLTNCEGEGEQEGREELLAEAVRTLSGAGGEVYIDAGNPRFVTDVNQLADGLRASGVQQAAGFALNVSNFIGTEEVRAYGDRISDAVGGARYVVDTSRNGRGAYDGPEQPTWCNPPGRALGTPPTRDTGSPRVAAYLWVKEPGDSDGDCRGAPAAGEFWPQYALELANNTPGA
ncbi:MAG: endoglucanase [Actinomycetospora sp.]|jgi:endoglucanase|nr:endoglucanase [Actinomycetospora sp.]